MNGCCSFLPSFKAGWCIYIISLQRRSLLHYNVPSDVAPDIIALINDDTHSSIHSFITVRYLGASTVLLTMYRWMQQEEREFILSQLPASSGASSIIYCS